MLYTNISQLNPISLKIFFLKSALTLHKISRIFLELKCILKIGFWLLSPRILNKKELKNQEKSIRRSVPSFLSELIVSTFSVTVNFSVEPTNNTYAKCKKCVG